jgi:serine/threonine protein kinase/formylglycine-generating enzyme required for sulfatase activity
MLCYKCLHQVSDDAEVCPFCGQKLKIKSKKDATPPPSKPGGEQEFQGDVTMVLKPSERAPLPVAKEFQIGDTIIERFEVREVLAQEGLFYSYKVRDKKEKKTKVLKLISASFIDEKVIKRFKEHFQQIKNLTHKSLPEIYEIMDIDGLPFFTMEYLEGLNLRKLLSVRAEGQQFFTLQEADPIITPLMDVVEYIHSRNMIHGDLKPENILILPDTIKITDTGIYKLLDPQEFISLQLALGDAYYYLSPEFITHHQEITPVADIYSIGVILYEMFTGVVPKGEQKSLKEYNKDVPDALEKLIHSALEEKPEERTKNINGLKRQWYPLVGKEPPEEIVIQPAEIPSETLIETINEVVSEQEMLPEKAIETPPEAVETKPIVEAEKKEEKPAEVLKEEELLVENKHERIESAPKKEVKREEVFELHEEATTQPIELAETEVTPKQKLPAGEPTKVIPFPVKPVQEAKKGSPFPFIIAGVVFGIIAIGGIVIFKFTQKKEEVAPEIVTRQDVKVAKPPVVMPKSIEEPVVKEPVKENLPEGKKPEAEDKLSLGVEKKTEKSTKKEEPKKIAAAKPPPPPEEKPKCPDGMVYVPAGNFIRGSSGDDPLKDALDLDLGRVYVNEFCIDIYEYPNQKGSIPLANVSFQEATALCKKENKRLCSEDEWEKACKGPDFYKFPYGNDWNANACNTEDEQGNDRTLSSAGKWPKCRSGYGVMDMSGNLREWTDTKYSTTVKDMVVKGGSYTKPDWATRCAVRYNMGQNTRDSETGFRCCSGTLY